MLAIALLLFAAALDADAFDVEVVGELESKFSFNSKYSVFTRREPLILIICKTMVKILSFCRVERRMNTVKFVLTTLLFEY